MISKNTIPRHPWRQPRNNSCAQMIIKCLYHSKANMLSRIDVTNTSIVHVEYESNFNHVMKYRFNITNVNLLMMQFAFLCRK